MKFLRLPQVIELCALRRSAIFARVASGRMPSPYHLGSCAVWSDQEIQEWLQRVCEHGEPAVGTYSAPEHGQRANTHARGART